MSLKQAKDGHASFFGTVSFFKDLLRIYNCVNPLLYDKFMTKLPNLDQRLRAIISDPVGAV